MKNLIILMSLLTMLCLVFSCGKDEIDFNENFELKYEQLAQLNSGDLQIKVVEVLEDSRCPHNAICTWPGQIRLKLEVIENSITSNEEITFFLRASTDVLVGEYLINLVDVIPETDAFEEIELDDYTFTFIVTEQ